MKAKDIFIKTLPFVWMKLLLWLVTFVASIVWFAILALIAAAAKNGGVTFFAVVLWVGGIGLIRFILMRYFGYLIKAGHIAVITEAVVTGKIPENQVEYGKKMVIERFATANVFFLVDMLVSGAVKQIQRVVGKIGNLVSFIPGMRSVTSLAQFFVEISLGYVDECCLGYTFYNKGQSAFKSAADGVVIYAQNWKKLLANAAKTMLKVILIMLVVVVVFALLFSAILKLLPSAPFVGIAAFIFACLLAVAVKSAFLDSFILVQTMAVYMQVAPDTVITFDLYDKLCGFSRKFKDLFTKAREDKSYTPGGAGTPAAAWAGGGAASMHSEAPFYDGGAQAPTTAAATKSVFCTNCGNKVTDNNKFCQNCGQPIG